MTSYFDDLAREVRDFADCSDGEFIDQLREIEKFVANEVSLVTGDREFPDDLRERIQGVIAVHGTFTKVDAMMGDKAAQRATATRSSRMFEDLHDAFHDLARRRITTRFGLMLDDPRAILVLRDEYDEEFARARGLGAEDER